MPPLFDTLSICWFGIFIVVHFTVCHFNPDSDPTSTIPSMSLTCGYHHLLRVLHREPPVSKSWCCGCWGSLLLSIFISLCGGSFMKSWRIDGDAGPPFVNTTFSLYLDLLMPPAVLNFKGVRKEFISFSIFTWAALFILPPNFYQHTLSMSKVFVRSSTAIIIHLFKVTLLPSLQPLAECLSYFQSHIFHCQCVVNCLMFLWPLSPLSFGHGKVRTVFYSYMGYMGNIGHLFVKWS